MTKIIIIAMLAIILILIIKMWIWMLKCKAIIYYLVDKNYTAPTEKDIERCIKLVTEKTVSDWLRNDVRN